MPRVSDQVPEQPDPAEASRRPHQHQHQTGPHHRECGTDRPTHHDCTDRPAGMETGEEEREIEQGKYLHQAALRRLILKDMRIKSQFLMFMKKCFHLQKRFFQISVLDKLQAVNFRSSNNVTNTG